MDSKNVYGRARIAKTILKLVEFVLADTKISYKANIIKIVWYGCKNKNMDQRDRIGNPEKYMEALYSHMTIKR